MIFPICWREAVAVILVKTAVFLVYFVFPSLVEHWLCNKEKKRVTGTRS